ncbi:GbpC/Spa domain-containing protein, partial [Parvimonas micra]|uniref:GbpC/Spa domain-containing protein n=1 Tax=Parvimonas micra TaxID=33033 RepID=UPI002B4878B8
KIDPNPANGYNDFITTEPNLNPQQKERTVLRKGIPLNVRYTNLQKSYFKGKKNSKDEYTYTLKEKRIQGLKDMLDA